MTLVTRSAIAIGLLIVGSAAASAAPFVPTGRQCYGPWTRSVNPGCHYRVYYSKPKPTSPTYHMQRVYYYESKPEWMYFYNPESQKYWCCCPTTNNPDPTCKMKAMSGAEWWGVLPPALRKKDLDDCVDDFPPASDDDCPVVPDSSDGELMDMPPPGLPV